MLEYKIILGTRSAMDSHTATLIFSMWRLPTASRRIAYSINSQSHDYFINAVTRYWAVCNSIDVEKVIIGNLDDVVIHNVGHAADALRESELARARAAGGAANNHAGRPISLKVGILANLGPEKISLLAKEGVKTMEALATLSITAERALRLSKRSAASRDACNAAIATWQVYIMHKRNCAQCGVLPECAMFAMV